MIKYPIINKIIKRIQIGIENYMKNSKDKKETAHHNRRATILKYDNIVILE